MKLTEEEMAEQLRRNSVPTEREQVEQLRNKRLLKEEVALAEAYELPNIVPELNDPNVIVAGITANMRAKSNRLEFISPAITELIPLVPSQQLMLIGARSGQGKSTCVANIACSLVNQGKRVLIIANEETNTNVFERIALLQAGLSKYAYDHSRLSDPEVEQFKQIAANLTKSVTVIDTTYRNDPRWVTAADRLGHLIDQYLEPHKRGERVYDAVIIDYYQNIRSLTYKPKCEPWEAQSVFNGTLDNLKNVYNVSLILFAQLYSEEKRGSEFEDRIKNATNIIEKATLAIELATDRENFSTIFAVAKDRSFGKQDLYIEVGFDRDLATYVDDLEDPAFQLKVRAWKQQQQQLGLKNVDERKKQVAVEKQMAKVELAKQAKRQQAEENFDRVAAVAEEQFQSADYRAGQSLIRKSRTH